MTNTVIHMIHCVDRELIHRLFSKFANKYGKLWTTRLGEGGDWAGCVDDWLEELSRFSMEQVRAAVNKALAIYRDFPPTQGQLIDLCFAESGVPDMQNLINLMVARDFSHPLVKMVYDKIGSWSLSNGKEAEIQAKAKEVYRECLADFTLDPQKCWQKLTDYNARPKELPAPSKIPSEGERKSLLEYMNKCQETLKSKKVATEGKTYKEFDKNKITKGHKEFDKTVYEEYRAYLTNIPETETMTLPPHYLYARNKLLNARDQKSWLLQQGYVPPSQRINENETRSNTGRPTKIYKSWISD